MAGDKASALTAAPANSATHVLAGGADITPQLTSGGGQIGGLLTARDQDIPLALGKLDTLAYAVANAVNAANSAGTDGNGSPGGPIFTAPSGSAGAAAAIGVAITDPEQIAAAGAGLGPADGSNATSLANLRNAAIAGGVSPSSFYAATVTQIGNVVSSVQSDGDALQASLAQLTNQQSALSSVNLNEQAMALQTFEQAYQAASKVVSILNTVMAAAINLGTETTVN